MIGLISLFAIIGLAAAAPGGYGYGLGSIALPVSTGVILASPQSTGAIIDGPKDTGVILTGPSSTGAVLTSKVGSGSILTTTPLLLPAVSQQLLCAPVAPLTYAVPTSYGAAVLTKGGGIVAVSGAGAVVSGPKTVPVLINGPSGKISADGLWGPTLEGLPNTYGKSYY